MNIIEDFKNRCSQFIINLTQINSSKIYVDINPENLYECSKILYSDLDMRFITASGIEVPKGIEILYHFCHDKTGTIISLRVLIENKDKPSIKSLISIFKASSWIEREIHEMLGVNFEGHPNLKHLLLPEDTPNDKHPLRKNYDR